MRGFCQCTIGKLLWAQPLFGRPDCLSWYGDIKGSPYLNDYTTNWKASGMAGVKVSQAYAPKDCQRCHTASGYLRFSNQSSTNPIATPADKYSEPITCNACHNSETPAADFSVRTVAARTGYYNYSSAATGKLLVSAPFPSSQASNVCIGCHTGREAGDTIKAMAAATAHKSYSSAFWQNVKFVSSHWLTAGGQVFGVTGYEYPGQNYTNAVNHAVVGSDTTVAGGAKGPCVTCHMPGKDHSRNPWGNGNGYAPCVTCHNGHNPQPTMGGYPHYSSYSTAQYMAKNFTCTNCHNTPGAAFQVYTANRQWAKTGHGTSANLMFPGNLAAGYEYRTNSGKIPAHEDAGEASGRGPCVECHMTSPDKHSFSVISTSSNGIIGAIRTTTCATAACHTGGAVMTTTTLQAKKDSYLTAVAMIKASLETKGIYYNRDKPPYFFTVPAAAQQSPATKVVNWKYNSTFRGSDLYGAAFNLRLFGSGAGWVHNGVYSRCLLHDTLSYLDDGNATNELTGLQPGTDLYDYLVNRP